VSRLSPEQGKCLATAVWVGVGNSAKLLAVLGPTVPALAFGGEATGSLPRIPEAVAQR
jgi:hypothetical protein